MGESRDSGRVMGWSGVLDIVEVSVQVSVKTARGQIVCPDRRSGLVLRLSGLKQNSLRFPGFSKRGEEQLLSFSRASETSRILALVR